jgi:hypothetical protein
VRISRIRFVRSRFCYAIDGVDDASGGQWEAGKQRVHALPVQPCLPRPPIEPLVPDATRVRNAVPGICRASFAIRSSFVETVSGVGVPAIVPPKGSVTRQRLPSAGSLGRLSSFVGTTRCYDFSPLFPLRLSSPSAPRYRSRRSHRRRGNAEISQVPGEPLLAFAALSDSGRAFVPSHEGDLGSGELRFAGDSRPRVFFPRCRCLIPSQRRCLAASRHAGAAPAVYKRKDPNHGAFEAQSHGLSARCLRFAPPPRSDDTQDSLAAGGQPLLRGTSTRRAPFEVSPPTWFLLGQAFPGAMYVQLSSAEAWPMTR